MRQSLIPAPAPVVAQGPPHFSAKAGFDGRNDLWNAVIKFKRANMLVEISGLGGSTAQGMHLSSGEAVEVVELHGGERRAKSGQFGGRRVELSALVIRADDEEAHVLAARGLDRRPVQVVDEVPVEIYVVELAGVDGFEDEIGRGVGGEPDETAPALLLELARGIEASALFDGPIEQLPVVDPMERQQIDVIQLQVGHRFLERGEEVPGSSVGCDLGLDDDFVAGQGGEQVPQLHFGGAIAARGFNVVDAEFEGAMDGGLKVGLVVGRNFGRRHILPLELIAHAAAGKDGHLEFSAAETTVFHGRIKPRNRFVRNASGDIRESGITAERR